MSEVSDTALTMTPAGALPISCRASSALRTIPNVKDDKPAALITERPTSIYAEAFRIARTGLFGARGWPTESAIIAFTSSLPGEGKTTSSLAFSRSLADSQRRTLIIDCDVRRAALPGASGVVCDKGLVEYLGGEAEISDIVVHADNGGRSSTIWS